MSIINCKNCFEPVDTDFHMESAYTGRCSNCADTVIAQVKEYANTILLRPQEADHYMARQYLKELLNIIEAKA